MLNTLDYEIISSNDSIEPDGGVDFVAQKDNKIVIGQCKKSDWSNGTIGSNPSNISEPSVKQHFATVILNRPKYPDNKVVGYFVTLRKFSLPCRTTFAKEPSIKLIDFDYLQKLTREALVIIDSQNKQIILIPSTNINIWYDQDLERIQKEIELLEALVAGLELELEQENNKYHQAQKLIMNELIDLYREIDLIKLQIKFIVDNNLKKSQENDDDIDQEINDKYQAEQQKVNQEYDDIENEFIELEDTILSEEDLDKAKKLYRELCHLYHPDKHPDNPTQFETIFKVINKSKGNLEALIDICNNPQKYFGGTIPGIINRPLA